MDAWILEAAEVSILRMVAGHNFQRLNKFENPSEVEVLRLHIEKNQRMWLMRLMKIVMALHSGMSMAAFVAT